MQRCNWVKGYVLLSEALVCSWPRGRKFMRAVLLTTLFGSFIFPFGGPFLPFFAEDSEIRCWAVATSDDDLRIGEQKGRHETHNGGAFLEKNIFVKYCGANILNLFIYFIY